MDSPGKYLVWVMLFRYYFVLVCYNGLSCLFATKEYKGICSTDFKDRYGNHNESFNNQRYKTDTELSKEIWAVKDKNGTPKISWSI